MESLRIPIWVRFAVAAPILAFYFLDATLFTDPIATVLPLRTTSVSGHLWYVLGQYDRAAQAYKVSLREAAEFHHVDKTSVSSAFLTGDLTEARTRLDAEYLGKTWTTDAHLLAGQIALGTHDWILALEHARDILAYAPHQREAWILASIAHTKLGQHRAALDDLKQALRPDAVGAWSFAVLDILDTAGGLARQSSENQPLCLLAHYYRLLRVVDRSNGPLAVRAARNAIDKGDYPDEAYLTIGVVHYRSQQPEEAFEAFQQSVASNPHNADALHWAAIAYSDRGDLSGEYRMREAARNASPDDPLYSRAFAQLVTAKLGDLHQGLTIAKSALARTPTSSERLAEVGRMYRELGEFEQALAHFVEAIEHTPTEVR